MQGGVRLESNLKKFRKKIKMKQEEVAKIINYSRQYYSCVERGKKRGSVEFYQRIQDKFDLTDAETWVLTKNT